MSTLSLKDRLRMSECEEAMDDMLESGLTEHDVMKSQVYQEWCDLCDKERELDNRFQYDERGDY